MRPTHICHYRTQIDPHPQYLHAHPKALDLGARLRRVNRVRPLQTVTTLSVLIRLQGAHHLRGVRLELSHKS
jgi:hypothetical protein